MIDKIRLLNKDVLITPINKNEVFESIIHVVESDEHQQPLNYFRVLKVSPEVTEVQKDDIIMLRMGNHTPVVYVDTFRVAITSEDDVEAVVEK